MTLKQKIIIAGISVCLILLSILTPIASIALNYLTDTSEKMLASLVIVADLNILAGSVESSRIPILSGTAKGLSETLSDTFNYLTMSNILVFIQIVLVKLSKSWFIKILSLLLVAALFLKRYNITVTKILILVLMINPGLPVYVNAIHYLQQAAQLDPGLSLHEELAQTREKFEAQKDILLPKKPQIKKQKTTTDEAEREENSGRDKKPEKEHVTTEIANNEEGKEGKEEKRTVFLRELKSQKKNILQQK